jgi:hypothetical protein
VAGTEVQGLGDQAGPGWYPDPDRDGRPPWGIRWWDGKTWTQARYWWAGRRWRRVGTLRSTFDLLRVRNPGRAVLIGGTLTLAASIGTLFAGQAWLGWAVSPFLPMVLIVRGLMRMAAASEDNRRITQPPTTLPRPPRGTVGGAEDPGEPWRHSELTDNPRASCCICTNPPAQKPRRHVALSMIWPAGGTMQALDAHEACLHLRVNTAAPLGVCAVCGDAAVEDEAFHLRIADRIPPERLSLHERCAKGLLAGNRR